MPPRGHTIWVSVGRTDRTGPTFAGAWELKTASKRVMPPFTISSYTASAWSTPHWGSASGVFSIFTLSAGRVSDTPVGSTTPVSGATGKWWTVVLVVVVAAVVWCRWGHATTSAAAATTTNAAMMIETF